MSIRSTAEHRAAVEAWKATAPANDHQIFGSKAKAEKPRHRDLGELSSLLAMYRRPVGVAEGEGVPVEPPAPVKTNWSLTPANDNHASTEEGEQLDVERSVEIIPSIGTIRRETAEDKVIKYGHYVDDNGERHKIIVQWGALRFSDGTQTEKGSKLVEGKVVDHNFRMPVGSMLGTREKSTRDKGSAPDPLEVAASNMYFGGRDKDGNPVGLFNAQRARRVKKAKRKERTGPKTKAEAHQWLADAIANTPNMPPVKKCPDGFPAGPANLAQLFPGLVKVATGNGGSQAWQDVVSERAEQEEFARGLQLMKDKHVKVLTEAMSARSLTQIGEARGYKGRHAIEAGRRLLVAANDDFLQAMELAKYAAESA